MPQFKSVYGVSADFNNDIEKFRLHKIRFSFSLTITQQSSFEFIRQTRYINCVNSIGVSDFYFSPCGLVSFLGLSLI